MTEPDFAIRDTRRSIILPSGRKDCRARPRSARADVSNLYRIAGVASRGYSQPFQTIQATQSNNRPDIASA